MADGTSSKPSEVNSPRGSSRSSQQGNKVHWLLQDREVVERLGGRFVSEEDLVRERECWIKRCLCEVRSLEKATMQMIKQVEDSIHVHIGEATNQLQSEVAMRFLQQTEAERTEHVAALAELQRGLGMHRSLQNQVTAAQAAIADLRSELNAERERQELQADSTKTMLSDFRHDLSALQVNQIQDLKDQALRSSSDVSRGIQEVHAALAASQTSLKADVHQEVEAIRSELERERAALDGHVTSMKNLEDTGRALSDRIEVTERMFLESKQDAVSATMLLRGRIEAVVDERDEQLSQTATLQRILVEDQSRRAVEVRALLTRLEGLEQRFAASASTAPARAELEALAARLERLEQRPLPGDEAFESARGAAALRARLETLEAVCLGEDGKAVSNGTVKELQRALGLTQSTLDRLAQDLAEERSERVRAVSDVGRLSEDVANAAAAIIERAEKKFSEELATGLAEAPCPRAPDVAALGAEALLREAVGRVATAEARAGALEERLDGELRRAGALPARLEARVAELEAAKLETAKLEAAQLSRRVAALEVQVKKHTLSLGYMLDESANRKTAVKAITAIEQDVRRSLEQGPAEADVAAPQPAQSQSPLSCIARRKDASSCTPSERSTASTALPRGAKAVGAVTSMHGAAASLSSSSADPLSWVWSGPEPDGLQAQSPALVASLKSSLGGLASAVNSTLAKSQRSGTRSPDFNRTEAPPRSSPRIAASATRSQGGEGTRVPEVVMNTADYNGASSALQTAGSRGAQGVSRGRSPKLGGGDLGHGSMPASSFPSAVIAFRPGLEMQSTKRSSACSSTCQPSTPGEVDMSSLSHSSVQGFSTQMPVAQTSPPLAPRVPATPSLPGAHGGGDGSGQQAVPVYNPLGVRGAPLGKLGMCMSSSPSLLVAKAESSQVQQQPSHILATGAHSPAGCS